ncbi:MAG: UDP-N-acetylmuramoyl-tripeptide--D-alanyl-D-alanine ligase [Candidatus Moraniibacteriota bacterium]|nr:MAG: UDP-N-acetylmuramoyl-tripeptide--D-alanyl-D-alanine ligase [Candidatus Moranbacteria bacterium]
MRMFVQKLLGFFTRWILRRARPMIIGITGSIGKSSSKEALALVLSKSFTVRASDGNLNNEFGVPLTVLGVTSPGRSIVGWIRVFSKALWISLFPARYPEVLILELGIDRPGDMDYLLSLIGTPTVGVLTHVSNSHLEFFGTVGAIGKEKGKLLSALPEDGFAVVNADNYEALREATRTKAKVLTYGFGKEAVVRAEHLRIIQEQGMIEGVSFKLNYAGKTVPVRLPGLIARHQVGSILSAVAVGIALKMNLVDIGAALLSFRPLPGRLTMLAGEDGRRILDDTYNASPTSIRSALATLREIIAPRKVVVLGDVLELGASKLDEHRKLAPDIIGSGATVFVGVGQYMAHLAASLHGTHFPSANIFSFPDAETAIRTLPTLLRPGDLVLVKGSQGMRMEKISAALLAPQVDPVAVLPRQSKNWQATPWQAPAEWEIH